MIHFQEDIRSTVVAQEFKKISSVCIVTRDRPDSLRTCLESYAGNIARHHHSPEFVVSDDSTNSETAEFARATAQKAVRDLHISLRYAGGPEKRAFARSLAAESGVPLELVHFAIFGDPRCDLSTGANRNAVLLDTGGRLILAVDDDTLCKISTPADSQTQLAFFPGYDPTQFGFFPSRTAALESASFADNDVLGCHTGLLGSEASSLGSDRAGRVVFTLHGLIGDSGMASPRHYLTLSGESRERLVASPEIYRAAFSSREILRAVRQPTIACSPFCMTTFLGIDNRLILPPFFPVQRNSDGIFGQMVHKYVEGSLTAFLPWSLLHAPAPPRIYAPDALRNAAAKLRTSDLIIDAVLASEEPLRDVTTAARLIDLGKHLERLGRLSAPDFEEYFLMLQEQRNFGFVAALHGQLQRYGEAPEYWSNDVRRMIELLSAAAGTEDYVVPADLTRNLDAGPALELAQELVETYGVLLQAWPALVESATKLSSAGHRLSVSFGC